MTRRKRDKSPGEPGSLLPIVFVLQAYALAFLMVSTIRYRSFKDFVINKMPAPGFDDKYRHVMPQTDMLFDEGGTLLVDFVGKFENLQADFDQVCARLGFDSHRDAIMTVAEITAVLCHTDAFDINRPVALA